MCNELLIPHLEYTSEFSFLKSIECILSVKLKLHEDIPPSSETSNLSLCKFG